MDFNMRRTIFEVKRNKHIHYRVSFILRIVHCIESVLYYFFLFEIFYLLWFFFLQFTFYWYIQSIWLCVTNCRASDIYKWIYNRLTCDIILDDNQTNSSISRYYFTSHYRRFWVLLKFILKKKKKNEVKLCQYFCCARHHKLINKKMRRVIVVKSEKITWSKYKNKTAIPK